MSTSKGGGPRGGRPDLRANEAVPRVGVRDWTCTESCGYKASGRREAIKHLNAAHAHELKDGESAVRALLSTRRLACCTACYRVTAATAEGTARASHTCKAAKDEAHDAPLTLTRAMPTKRQMRRSSGSLPAARSPKRRKGEARAAPTTPSRLRRTTAGGSARRSSAAESSGARLARSASALSAGRVVETGVSASGRTLKRRLFHDEETADEGAAAGGEPSADSPPPAPTPPAPAPAPVEVLEAPVRESFATFAAWTGKILPLFEKLNGTLAGDGPATRDAILLLDRVLKSSWHADRAVHVWESDDAKAEAMEANDAKRADPTWAALRNLKDGLLNRATQSCSSKGFANLGLEEARNALEAKYPAREEDLTEEVLNAWKTAAPVDLFSSDDVGGAVSKKKKGSGGDDHRWTYDDLKGLASAAGGYAFATPLVNAIAQGRFNHDAMAIELLTVLRGIALAKVLGDSTKVRPIGIGVIFTALAGSLLSKRHMPDFKERAGPRQYAVGTAGGVEAVGRIALVCITRDLAFGWTDGVNAFGSSSRQKMLEELNEVSGMVPFNALRYANDPKVRFKTTRTEVLQILQTEGGIQGCAAAMPGYCTGQTKALAVPLKKLLDEPNEADKILAAAYADDRGLGGRVKAIINAERALGPALEANFGVRPGKTHVYKPDLPDDDRAALEAADCVIEEGGTVFAGTPVGSDEFVKTYTMSKADELIKLLAFAERVAMKDGVHGVQLVVRWMRMTIGATFNHVLRNVAPRLVAEAAAKLDDAVVDTVLRLTGCFEAYAAASPEERARARALIQLPIASGGAGFHSQVMLAEAAYLGAWASTLHLVVGPAAHALRVPSADEGMPSFLADFEKAREEVRTRVPSSIYDQLDPRVLWEKPTQGIQAVVAAGLHNDARKRLVSLLPTGASLDDRGQRIHALGQNTPEAGAWLTANPLDPRNKMTDGAFSEAMRMRLLLPDPRIKAAAACDACAAPLDLLGTHATCCSAIDRSNRHKQVQEAVISCVKEAATFWTRAPIVESFYPKKVEAADVDTDDTRSQADIGITLKDTSAGFVKLVDFVVVAAVKGQPAAYASAGTAAEKAELDKVKKYGRYDIKPDCFVGFGVETTGALGPAAKRLLWAAANAGGGNAAAVAWRYRRWIEHISVTVQAALYYSHCRLLALCVKPDEG